MSMTEMSTTDEFDRAANAAGFEKVVIKEGAAHYDEAPFVYRKGVRHIWRVDGARTGLWWMTADLVDGAFRRHKKVGTLADALARPLLPATVPLCASADDRTKWIEAHAAYFTAVRVRGRTRRDRREFDTREDAEHWAKREHSDGRTMIYAVAADGQSAHVVNV